MDGLELILLLLVKVTHLGKDLGIAWNLGDENVVPFEGFTPHSNQLINMSDLVEHLVAVWNDRVELFKSLEGLIVVSEALVDKTKVIDSLNAVGLNTNGLKEKFLGAVKLLVNK